MFHVTNIICINIKFNSNIIDCTFNDNVITFKKGSIVINEFIMPESCEIKKIGAEFITIALKSLQPPKEFPKGYGNLKFSGTHGTYEITSFDETSKHSKTLYFIDTSIIQQDLFQKISSKFGIQNAKIPNNFWFSNQYRDFKESWETLKEAINYAKNFDLENASDLISQLELVCLYYYDMCFKDVVTRGNIRMQGIYSSDVQFRTSGIFPENWDYPACINNEFYCRMNYGRMTEEDEIYINEPLDITISKPEALYSLPVIRTKKITI